MNIGFIFIQLLSLTMVTSALENYKFSIADDLEAAKSFNRIQLTRKKRDDCTIVEALNILENGVNVVVNLPIMYSKQNKVQCASIEFPLNLLYIRRKLGTRSMF
jgi:hypothetical protein